MPTATKFTALGAGNGFPSCLPKIDVSLEDKWTTLGGWSKINTPVDNAAKAESIASSLTQAMKLFWSINGFDGSYHQDYQTFTKDVTLTLDMYNGDYEFIDWYKTAVVYDSDVNKEPWERVCYKRFSAANWSPSSDYTEQIALNVTIVRMYDGVATNEDNFVGYGSSGALDIWTDTVEGLELYAWYDEPFGITEYVVFSGAHYVANLEAEQPDGFPDANYSIAVDGGGNLVGSYTEGAPVTYELEITIEPFDFYTY
tara:strand:+ start:621 stop:1388 length:768 start_codon:yes stop_codon:yes gene_type:complete